MAARSLCAALCISMLSLVLISMVTPRTGAAASPPPFLLKWGSLGTGDTQFDTPAFVATDAAGNVYVTDNHNRRIQKFSSSGALLEAWGWGVATGAGAYEICTSGCQAGILGAGGGASCSRSSGLRLIGIRARSGSSAEPPSPESRGPSRSPPTRASRH